MTHEYPRSVIVSRTDSIGDVVLTLPVCAAIKRLSPQARVMFLCSSYTAPVVESCRWVDETLIWPGPLPAADAILHVFPRKQVARAARHIPIRIGTYSRLFHWTTCNRLVRLHRKNSPLHELELNLKLLAPIFPVVSDVLLPQDYGLEARGGLPDDFRQELERYAAGRPVVLLHPKSKGSAREWPAAHWRELNRILTDAGYAPVITGTAADKTAFTAEAGEDYFFAAGRLDLYGLMRLIAASQGVIAASTGPLHLSAALGRKALGLYPPIRPMHPGRWAPRGPRARALALNVECNRCRKNGPCYCIQAIEAAQVALEWSRL